MISLKGVTNLFTDQSSAVDVLGGYTVSGLAKQFAELAVGIVGVGGILILAKIANPHVLGVVWLLN